MLIVGSALGCMARISDLDDAGMPDASVDAGNDAGYEDAGPIDAGCTYPAGDAGFHAGQVFPDFPLGVGFLNIDGRADASEDGGPVAARDALLQLHCSGRRYVLIDLSTVWCVHSLELAARLPVSYVPGWLDAGGLVMTVLEQGPDPSLDGGWWGYSPATASDLSSWASLYRTNYSLVNDPTEGLAMAAAIPAWPSLFIVDLSTMEVVDSVYGSDLAFLSEYTTVLSAASDAG